MRDADDGYATVTAQGVGNAELTRELLANGEGAVAAERQMTTAVG
jgi:hypothetical protein